MQTGLCTATCIISYKWLCTVICTLPYSVPSYVYHSDTSTLVQHNALPTPPNVHSVLSASLSLPIMCIVHPKLLFCSDLHKHRLMHYFVNLTTTAVLNMYCPNEKYLLFLSLLCVLPFAVALFCILSAMLCVTVRYAMPGVQRFPIRRQNTPLSRQDTPKTQPEVKLDCWWLIFAFWYIALLIFHYW